MESKLPNILIILIVFAVFIFAVFYTFGLPLREKIKNIGCAFLQDKLFELKSCEKGPTAEEIQKQTQQVQLQNVQTLTKAMGSQINNCGKTDPNLKCRCTYSFGSIGTNPIIIRKLKDQVKIITTGGQQETINLKDFYYDDKNHNLDETHKLNEEEEVILQRSEDLEKFSIRIRKKGQSVQEAQLYKEYSHDNEGQLSIYIDSLGFFKDNNKIGLYLPQIKPSWIFSEDREGNKLEECRN